MVCGFCVRVTVRQSDSLAQARGEPGSPRRELQSQNCVFVRATRSGGMTRFLGDLLLRSGKNISPKRENEDVRLCFGVPRKDKGIRVLGDKVSRLGERFSLKQDLLLNFAFCLTCRLGECLRVWRSVSSPRRGGTRLSENLQVNQSSTLAQARKLNLSETGLVA